MKVVELMKKIVINKTTSNFMAKMNARIAAWQKKGVSERIIEDYMSHINMINGIAYEEKKRGAAGKKLTTDRNLTLSAMSDIEAHLPTWSDLNKIEKKVTAEMANYTGPDGEARRQYEGKYRYDQEVKLMRNKASEDLWDQWYEGDTHSDSDKNNWVMSVGLAQVEDNIKSKLLSELHDLASDMGKDKASAEDIWEFEKKVEYVIEHGKLPD